MSTPVEVLCKVVIFLEKIHSGSNVYNLQYLRIIVLKSFLLSPIGNQFHCHHKGPIGNSPSDYLFHKIWILLYFYCCTGKLREAKRHMLHIILFFSHDCKYGCYGNENSKNKTVYPQNLDAAINVKVYKLDS